MKHAVLHQGGGWKGYFGIPILKKLRDDGLADRYAGTSVGAINLACAACDKLDAAEDFWEGISDPFVLDGIKGYLRLAMCDGGLFSMTPLRKKLEKNLSFTDLKAPLKVGVTRRDPFGYHELDCNRARSDRDFHDWILASAAIAFVMQPVEFTYLGMQGSWRDGGHWQTLPCVPGDAELVDAIVHHPLDSSVEVPPVRSNKLVSELNWFMWTALRLGQLRDMEMLHAAAKRGVRVRVWAPKRPLGGTLDASKDDLEMRREEGELAVKLGPVVL